MSKRVKSLTDPDKPVESKAAKFVRLCARRVAVAQKRLQHVTNLASRQSYEYTDAQKDWVLSRIEASVKALRDAFNHTPPNGQVDDFPY